MSEDLCYGKALGPVVNVLNPTISHKHGVMRSYGATGTHMFWPISARCDTVLRVVKTIGQALPRHYGPLQHNVTVLHQPFKVEGIPGIILSGTESELDVIIFDQHRRTKCNIFQLKRSKHSSVGGESGR